MQYKTMISPKVTMTKVNWERKLDMTEGEESVLVKMAMYFVDLGQF